MTHEKKRDSGRSECRFRGRIFHIPAQELIEAVRESRRLHDELMDHLAAAIEQHTNALRDERNGREGGPGSGDSFEEYEKCGSQMEAGGNANDEYDKERPIGQGQ